MLFETTYSYAGFDINAATDDDGEYWISQKTIEQFNGNKRFQAARESSTIAFKALVGEGFQLHQLKDNSV